MFKWLRNKMMKGSENEFRKCIDMCHTFIKFAEGQEMLSPTPIDIGAKFDYIYHNGIDKWKTDIVDPMKTKYPKPS